MRFEDVVAKLRDPAVSNEEAAAAVNTLPGSDLYRYIVALMWGAGRHAGRNAEAEDQAVS
jgi:hypothetical protein